MSWTIFFDMHSGGGTKEPPYELILIEAPIDDAVSVFYSRFGHSPYRVTCTCCGEDYSVDEYETLEKATAYHRNCAWVNGGWVERGAYGGGLYKTLAKFINQEDVLVIPSDEIRDYERKADVPQQGYIWV